MYRLVVAAGCSVEHRPPDIFSKVGGEKMHTSRVIGIRTETAHIKNRVIMHVRRDRYSAFRKRPSDIRAREDNHEDTLSEQAATAPGVTPVAVETSSRTRSLEIAPKHRQWDKAQSL